MKKVYIIIASILSLIAIIVSTIFVFKDSLFESQHKSIELKVDKSTSKSSVTDNDKVNGDKLDENVENSSQNDQLVSNNDTTGNAVKDNTDVLDTIIESTTEYQYDKSAKRAFEVPEVRDNDYYKQRVLNASFVNAGGKDDLPDKHGEIELLLSATFDQLNQLYDLNSQSKGSINPESNDKKALIAKDYFNNAYPTVLFNFFTSTKLLPDFSTLRVTEDPHKQNDYLIDVVLVNEDGVQYAFFTTCVKNGQFTGQSYQALYLREGAILLDQNALSTTSNQVVQ